jgi:hypothetical protein
VGMNRGTHGRSRAREIGVGLHETRLRESNAGIGIWEKQEADE